MILNFYKITVLATYCFIAVVKSSEHFVIEGHKYIVSYPLKKSWYLSWQFCTYNGLNLVDITTDEENERLLHIAQTINQKYTLNKNISFWTSGTDLGSEGSYYWMTTGHSIVYSNWFGKNPDNYYDPDLKLSENCLSLKGTRDFMWNDDICEFEYHFICRDTLSVPDTLKNKNERCTPTA